MLFGMIGDLVALSNDHGLIGAEMSRVKRTKAKLKTQQVLVLSILGMLLAPAVDADGVGVVGQDKSAGSMQELKQHFSSCLKPPAEAAASRPTFYFSLTAKGTIVAQPRIVWFGFKGDQEERKRLLPEIERSFFNCLPLKLSSEMASTLPGEVYFLQYVIGSNGQTTAVIFRPFGSHGGGTFAPLPLEPIEPDFEPPSPALCFESRRPGERRSAPDVCGPRSCCCGLASRDIFEPTPDICAPRRKRGLPEAPRPPPCLSSISGPVVQLGWQVAIGASDPSHVVCYHTA